MSTGTIRSEQLGVAQRCLEMTVAYVKERKQFARPVGSFQALKHRLADLWVDVTQAQAAARYTAACLAAGDPDAPVATALAKARCSELAVHAAEEIQAETGNPRLRGYQADLSALAQVRAFAEQVIASEPRLEVLVSNAGIGSTVPHDFREESADGYEFRFGVNYLAGYALTELLLPLLKSSAPSRIVNVSSAGQQAIDFGDVMLTSGYYGVRAYCQSKLAQILFTIDLAQQLDGSGVTVNALHPATYMPTKIVESPFSTIAEGVEATMHLIEAPVAEGGTGRNYNGLQVARADRQAYDAQARRQLRELSGQLTGLPAAG